ncbi:hypothetical protein BBJ28_00003226 [Nothophytophthora sp. Chile5]|nr:hypothetical protein BBJ28_00003226 [Nothophytophthora sp. Chile5]
MQPCRWLGLAVAQRYALEAPHGRCRTRENAHIKQGFFLPAAITKTNGQVLRPDKRIVDSCKDNETLVVQLQQEVPVNEIGAPQFTAWTVSAFFPSQQREAAVDHVLEAKADQKTSKLPAEMPAKHRHEHQSHAPSNEGLGDADVKGGGRSSSAQELKQYARAEMMQQVNSGQFLSDMEVEAAFLYDWGRLHPEEIEKEPREREVLQELLLSRFAALNAGYMHYATGSSELTYGMSGPEFAHFLHECELTKLNVTSDQRLTEKVITQCLRHDALVAAQDRGTMARAGFLHALLRVVQSLPPAGGSASSSTFVELLDNALNDHILPTIARLTSGPFRDHSHHDKMVAIFQEGKSKLLKLYAKYAQEYAPRPVSRKAGESNEPEETAPASLPLSATWPLLLSAAGLKSMLYDCGMFCSGTPEQHDELFDRAVDQSFTGMRDVANPENRLLVFAEFLEVTARVALAVLENENELPPRDAIKLALDAVRSLPVKPDAAKSRK